MMDIMGKAITAAFWAFIVVCFVGIWLTFG